MRVAGFLTVGLSTLRLLAYHMDIIIPKLLAGFLLSRWILPLWLLFRSPSLLMWYNSRMLVSHV